MPAAICRIIEHLLFIAMVALVEARNLQQDVDLSFQADLIQHSGSRSREKDNVDANGMLNMVSRPLQGLISKKMQPLLVDPKIREVAKYVAAQIDNRELRALAMPVADEIESMLKAPNWEHQARYVITQIDAMMNDMRYSKKIKRSAQQMEAMMASANLTELTKCVSGQEWQQQLKCVAQQVEALKTDTELLAQARRIAEQVEAMMADLNSQGPREYAMQKDVAKLASPLTDILADKLLQNLLARAGGLYPKKIPKFEVVDSLLPEKASPLQRADLSRTSLGKYADHSDFGEPQSDVESGIRSPQYLSMQSGTSASSKKMLLLEKIQAHYEQATVTRVDDMPPDLQKEYAEVPEIGIAVKVRSISNVNMATDTFDAGFNIQVAWRGRRDEAPDIAIYNGQVGLEIVRRDAKNGSEGWDWYSQFRVDGTFRQEYKLQGFPFDHQDLHIVVRFKSKYRLTSLPWGHEGESFSCDPRCLMDEYVFTDFKIKHRYMPNYKFGKLVGYDPEADLIFTIGRKSKYWVLNYAAVLSVTTSLMACTYGIDVDAIGDRLAVATTLVLTMLAMKFLAMDKLPNIPYLTPLDYHGMVCMAFLATTTAEMSFVRVLGVDQMRSLERLLLPIIAAMWLSYHSIVAVAVLVWTRGFQYSHKQFTQLDQAQK